MERRTFLKAGCALAIATGTGVIVNTLTGCSASQIYKTSITNNEVTVPVTRFTNSTFQIIRTEKSVYDIALRKVSAGNYVAFLMQCTHANNQLVSTGNGFNCPLHGSVFNANGTVLKGPASQPLKQFKTSVQEDLIVIYLS